MIVDERQHGADGDQDRREHRQADADEAVVGSERSRRESAADEPTQDHEDHHRDADRPERAERLAQEDLDLEPGQFPESAQHRSLA